ncbi:MAG: InlB B-repeat-containing protein, partial [Lachnospiraceae bacterium]|nr:InlB B-repeat-containing protein [Lachnospiraceae bacterium]
AKQEDGSYIRSICFDKEKSRKNISLDYAEYEMENFVKGEILPITAYITNKGNETIDNVNVYWDDTLLGNVTVAIPVGETVTVELKNFVVPEDVIGYEEHILKVSTENESDDSDNEYKLEIGMTDVAVSVSQRLKDGETWLDMGVYNTSCIATDVTLNIRADYLDGEILYTEELGTIEGGRGVTLTQPLEEYDKHYCTYYVEVVSTVQDALEGNNVEFVYTGAGRDVEGGELGYKPVYYTITFDSNGGSPIDSQTIEKGIFASQPMAPVKENHHFAGWYYNGVLYDFSSAVEEDITLTAQWTEYEKLVAPSANIVSGSKVDVGTKLALTCASVGASIYYTLDGTIPTTTADLYVEPITLLENTTVKAIAVQNGYYNSDVAEFTYEVVDMPNVYIVAFESNGGSIVESQQVVENECAARPTDPVWEGHKFLGWYVGDALYDFKTPVTDHLRLEAKWEKVNTPEEDEPSEVLPEDIPEDGIIPEGIWVAGTKDTVYTGEAVKQEFRVYDHKTLLKEKIDYTVTYKNNKLAYVYSDEDYAAFEENLKTTGKKKTIGTFNPAKAPQIIITMKENYSGSHTIYYKNESADIAQEGFVAENLTVTYSGKKQTPQPILTWNGKKLKYGTDYYVREYDAAKKDKSAYTAKGSYDLTIVGKKNFKGEIPIQLTISEGVNQIAFSKVTIKGIKNVPWDEGRQIVQKDYKLSYKKDDFTGDNAEYTVSWGTNTDVGTGTVTFTGTGVDADKDGYSYIGSKTVTFKITGTAMKDVEVTGVKSSYPYTGETITAEEKLSYKKDKNSEPMDLYEDTHYSVEYRNNTDKGTATIIFTGKESGGFTGTKKVTFKITARGIQDIVLDGNVTPQVNVNFIDSSNMIDDVYVAPYMKGGVKPEVTVTCGEITLEAGKDYTVSYGNNQKLALYTDKKAPSITIKGKGNYTGSKTVYFS